MTTLKKYCPYCKSTLSISLERKELASTIQCYKCHQYSTLFPSSGIMRISAFIFFYLSTSTLLGIVLMRALKIDNFFTSLAPYLIAPIILNQFYDKSFKFEKKDRSIQMRDGMVGGFVGVVAYAVIYLVILTTIKMASK